MHVGFTVTVKHRTVQTYSNAQNHWRNPAIEFVGKVSLFLCGIHLIRNKIQELWLQPKENTDAFFRLISTSAWYSILKFHSGEIWAPELAVGIVSNNNRKVFNEAFRQQNFIKNPPKNLKADVEVELRKTLGNINSPRKGMHVPQEN